MSKELNTKGGVNRFKFQSFNERVGSIKINVTKRVYKFNNEIPEDAETFFQESIIQWRELNCTKDFSNFVFEVQKYTKSLPMILFHKDAIANILLKHILIKDTQAYEPLLSLVISFTRDLQEEIYEYFPKFYEAITSLLSRTSEPKILESVFNTIAYLFKYLLKQLVADVDKTFFMMRSLFESNKDYIRRFASESFSFLLRRIKGEKLRNILTIILESVNDGKSNSIESYISGIGLLLSETIKHVNNQLYSRSQEYLEMVLDILKKNVKSDDKLDDPLFRSVQVFINDTCAYVNSDTSTVVYDILDSRLVKYSEEYANKSDDEILWNHINLSKLMIIVKIAAETRKGHSIHDRKKIFKSIDSVSKIIFKSEYLPHSKIAVKELLNMLRPLVLYSPPTITLSYGKNVFDNIFKCTLYNEVLVFTNEIRKKNNAIYCQIILPFVIKYISSNWNENSDLFLFYLFEMFTDFAKDGYPPEISSQLVYDGFLHFIEKKGNKNDSWKDRLLKYINSTDINMDDISKVSDLVYEELSENSQKQIKELASIVCLRHIEIPYQSINKDLYEIIKKYIKLSQSLFKEENNDLTKVINTNIGQLIYTYAEVCRHANHFETLKDLWDTIINDVLLKYPDDVNVLIGVAYYFEVLKNSVEYNEIFSKDVLNTIYLKLKDNISSFNHFIRKYTLNILSNFEIELIKDDDKKASMLFDLCKNIEEMPNAVNTYQEKMILLRRVNTLQVTGNISKTYREVLPRLCLGLLTNNFSVLWPETTKILSGISSLELSYFWDVFKPELLEFKDKVIKYTSGIFQRTREYLNSIESTEDLCELYFNKFLTYLSPEIPVVDYWNYENLLWKTLDHIPHIAERFSKLIVPKFFEFCHKEYKIDNIYEDEDEEEEENKDNKIAFNKTPKYNYNKMLQFLSLFSKFKNIKGLYKGQVLYDIYKRLLTKGDEKIQHACIKCLATYQEVGVVEYTEKLIALTEDNKFRDELSTLNIEDLRNQIEKIHQKPLMEVLICLLYGKVISKKGRNSSRSGAKARRIAIFSWLAGCETEDIQYMIDLMLKPFDNIKSSQGVATDNDSMDVDQKESEDESFNIETPVKRQLGLLSVLEDFIKQLRIKLDPIVAQLVNVILKLTYQAEHLITTNTNDDIHAILGDSNDENLTIAKLRDVRQQGLRRLCQLFSINLKFDFTTYMPGFFKRIISPRIPKFSIENTQAVTVVMEIVRAWAHNKNYVMFFVDYDNSLLPGLLSCLSAKKVHNSIVSLIISILEDILHLLDVPEEMAIEKVRARSSVPETAKEAQANVDRMESELEKNKSMAQKVIQPSINKILHEFEYLLINTRNINFQYQSSIALWRRIVNVLSNVSVFVTDGEHADKLIELLLPSLNKSVRIVPERTKEDILNITYNFLPLMNSSKKTEIEVNGVTFHEHIHFRYWSRLFMILESRKCRLLLCKIFNKLAEIYDYLKIVSGLLDDLNAFSERMIDEPDYDRRFDAYSKINQEYYKEFTSQQWLPVIYNFIFYLQTTDEFAVRTNSTYGISRVIERAEEERIKKEEGNLKKQSKEKEIEYEQFQNLVFYTCLPAVKRGIKSYKEEARHEFVTILGLMINKNKEHELLKDMVPLLAGDDEEANFFNNIYHMQIHRRIRALKRLTDELKTGNVNPRNISNIFVPIVNHFIYESDKSSEHNLINEAINTIGVASAYLTWGQYYTLVKNTLVNIKKKQQLEKVLIRVILTVLDNFHYDMKTLDGMEIEEKDEAKEEEEEEEVIDEEVELIEEDGDEDEQKADEEEKEVKEEKEEQEEEKPKEKSEGDAMEVDENVQVPKFNKIHDTVVNRLIPELYNYLTQKDELNVIVRTPVALAIVKLLKNLPIESMNEQLPKLLLNLCQILKSRQQEARDSTRDTLVKIANLLGPAYFSFIVTELQTTLLRGYQLHVLGYTIHSLLYSLVPTLEPGNIDDCMEPLIDILINDIFGEVGDEREIEELRGKMREIKGTKSFDSFELLSKIILLNNITVMLKPLKELMLESDSLKKMKNVEEILRRISVGLNSNTSIKAKELLLFTHGLITETLPFAQVENQKKKELTQAEKNAMVQMKRPTNTQEPLKNFKANAYLFVVFGFSVLLSGIKRDHISLKNQDNLEMLDPLVVSFGEALYSKHNKISILSMKILNTLIKCNIPKLKESWELIVKRLFQIIGRSRVTYNELIQNCFKLLISIIRDCYDVEITKFQLITLIKIIKIDLEEQENQSTTLSMIRAILARKYVVEDIYDLMNIVSNLIVTSQSTVMREQCRQIFITFLLDYPQSKNRLRNQISFFVNNLNYVYESGRVSVLEMLNLIISRFTDELISQFSEIFFLSLVVTMVNDDSSKCREMSGILIKQLIKRIHSLNQPMAKIYKLLEKWTSPEQPKNIQQAAIQAYGLIIDVLNTEFKSQCDPLMNILCKNIIKEVDNNAININSIEFDEDEIEYWELIYYSLNTFNKLINNYPQYLYSTQLEGLWNSIQRYLLHPHMWIRISANRLIGIFFSKMDIEKFKEFVSGKKLTENNVSQYQYLSDKIILWRLCLNMIEELNSDGLTEDLSQQIVKNLFFAGRCLFILCENETNDEEDNEEDNENEPEDGDKNAKTIKNPLMKIFRKLSYLARVNTSMKKSELMCISIYQWFAAMASVINMPVLANYLPVMISSLYRSVQDVTNTDNDKVKTLAQEVLDLLQKRAGVKAFLEVYNSVHKHVQEVRKERHNKRVVQSIIDPEASARRKVQKNEMKKAGRKRKIEAITSKKLKTKLSIKRKK
ncbi:hypothetical protein BCR36DRAFT_339402 [Piromyces finnis]|uniref:Uncharacterized protein n=1 Tax=Piromyces finnis TaxID=1754191 RepID=A0A1Y1UW50_9FUNG|nr:hypothetical protein BCR36DRAFT_339402 [Piromyces finnis]|eukprot:ORX41456.1 hypothetical protein BCR36DRAFT_339402 [Piromyces finnis]